MKIRSCFVSNSSSSSFICSIPNYCNDTEPMKVNYYKDMLSDAIRFDDKDEISKWSNKIEECQKECIDKNIIMFDVVGESMVCDGIMHSFENKIPGFKIVEEMEM